MFVATQNKPEYALTVFASLLTGNPQVCPTDRLWSRVTTKSEWRTRWRTECLQLT